MFVIVPTALLTAAAPLPGLSAEAAKTTADNMTPQAILSTMKRVADWQLAHPSPTIERNPEDAWTYGAFYAGVMALSDVADSPKYHDAMMAAGEKLHWTPAQRPYHADDHAVSQMYLDLYLQHRDPAMLGPTKAKLDNILANPSSDVLDWEKKGRADRYWWCDSLFMGPPVWLRLYSATGDKRYLEFVDKEWWASSDYLYDKEEHLYYRDSRYFTRREANDKKIFWSRGNGWVVAGLARVLQMMPPNHPTRGKYEQQFKEMTARIATLQQAEGLWRTSLLDPASYANEASGSGFHTFAMAWGINRGLLDRATFEPVVRKAWNALVACVTPEGKLEHVQPPGADPKKFLPTDSEVYGAGAFLLAGSELYRMALGDAPTAAYGGFLAQRMDDFAWENDRIAFRAYGPALERTGEISSGLDVWCKRTRKPVIERWYYKADYHTDHGEGLDFYKVGPTRGCGGTGIWRDGKLHVAKNFVTWRMIACGPTRVEFELGYAPFEAGGISVRETRRISLETGSNLNRIETRFDWTGGPDALDAVVGIVKRANGAAPDQGQDGSWLAYWEPEQATNGNVGCGIVMMQRAEFVDAADQYLLRTTVKRGEPLVYYAGAGWSRSGDFADRKAWVDYVSGFSRKTR